MIEIKHKITGAVLFRSETAENIRDALIEATKANAYLRGAYLRGAYLGDAYLGGADLGDAYLGGADLGGADLGGADLRGAYLRGAYLRGAYLRGAYLGGADLGGADLRGAYLGGADLGGADLGDAYLGGADLGGADLRGAYLRGAYLRGAYLRGANLGDAYLGGADLGDAYLGGADLGGADLGGAYLRGAYLRGADLGGAVGAPTNHIDPVEPYVRSANHSYANRAEKYRIANPNVPVIPDIDVQILRRIENGGALNMAGWHTCETTHCVGGWTVVVAGQAGLALENEMGTQAAARAIYLASIGRVPHFFASNDRALEDMKKRAAEQIGGQS